MVSPSRFKRQSITFLPQKNQHFPFPFQVLQFAYVNSFEQKMKSNHMLMLESDSNKSGNKSNLR